MKTLLLLPVALAALLAARSPFRPAPHELTDDRRAEIENQVTAFLASYLTVIEGGDPEATRGLFVADERFAWFTDGGKRYTSADEILASLAGMEGMSFSTEGSDVEVVALAPDLAHARSAFRTKILQGSAVVFEYSGVITWLLEEVKDAEWRVLTGHTSTPKER